jgi:hypothetical protein
VSYIDEAGPLHRQPFGWILHVVVGDGSPFGTFQGARSPNRRFSHLWVGKDGLIEQYQRLDRASWAQAGGNSTWWSVETAGDPDQALTGPQIDALAAWHVWCGAQDAIADSPGARGIGTHAMGGGGWGGHECPGKIRAGQRREILARARELRTGIKGDDVNLTDRIDVKGKDKNPITVEQAIRGAYLAGIEVRAEMDTVLRRLQEIEDRVQAITGDDK